ncbi:MAG TPA: DUF1624 domain-containing protein [Oscillospiraceae bacterium]|nr:DUF1624 domain-containing protein [Oscillospiraceae bacterium]
MKNGHTTRQKAPAGRYALLDELRGLDLVSMMLYHACWDMMFLFGIWMTGTRECRGVCGSRPSAGCSFCCPASVRPLGGTCCGAVLPCLPPERW